MSQLAYRRKEKHVLSQTSTRDFIHSFSKSTLTFKAGNNPLR